MKTFEGKKYLKFEGENRMTLNSIINRIGAMIGEEDNEKTFKWFMQAIRTYGVTQSICAMIIDLQNKEGKL